MPPTKKDKGKEKIKEPKPSDDFYLDLGDLPKSYANLMKDIPRRLEEIIKAEAPSTSKGKKLFKKISGKLYTAQSGTFLVHLTPDKDTADSGRVSLLFRWKDLYFEGFYSKGTYYELPPQSQLPYAAKGGKGVVILSIESNYAGIGGNTIYMGSDAFDKCLKAMLRAPDLEGHRLYSVLKSNRVLAVPVVGISEPLRFPQFQEWVLSTLSPPPTDADHSSSSDDPSPGTDAAESYSAGMGTGRDKKVPEKFSFYFTKWGTLSEGLLNNSVPEEFSTMSIDEMAALLGILRWMEGMSLPAPRSGTHDSEASSSRPSRATKGKHNTSK
ncbi:hypothetical protein DAI22_08g228700 [Oryza sativa Japonica Group]|nr:hypothetical protein DAI22_08g228700 [Oryza sativa Japonica Group]